MPRKQPIKVKRRPAQAEGKATYKSGRVKPEWHSRELIEEDSAKWFFIAGAIALGLGVLAVVITLLFYA